MGSSEGLSFKALKAIENSDVLIGAKRMIENFSGNKINAYLSDDIKKALDGKDYKTVSILVSGDTGFFSATKKLLTSLNKHDIEVIPGISSISYFSSKINIPWSDMKILSVHGRNTKYLGAVMRNEKTFLLTGGENKVETIINYLYKKGMKHLKIYVGENLSYENEKITIGNIEDLLNKTFESLSVMVIENNSPNSFHSIGINDNDFLRGEVPITKSEVRCIALSKLQLKEEDIVYDIGAGTGSVSIEAALTSFNGEVFAIEKNPLAVDLLKKNREKFKAYNMEIIEGEASTLISSLPKPDKVFIGGSGKKLSSIIEMCLLKNPNVKIVITAITLETLSAAIECFKKFNIKNTEVVQTFISKAKKVGPYNMMMGQNPIFILTGEGDQNVQYS